MILAGAAVTALVWIAPAVVAPTEPASVPEPWRSIARCESDLTWDEGDGGIPPHRGGLQWVESTWLAVKPAGAPDDPAEASAVEEVAAAETLMDQPWGSFAHWPNCARELGLIEGHR